MEEKSSFKHYEISLKKQEDLPRNIPSLHKVYASACGIQLIEPDSTFMVKQVMIAKNSSQFSGTRWAK